MCVAARTAALAAWSSGTLAPGAPCLTTPGTWQTPRLCAASWAVAGLWAPWWGPPSEDGEEVQMGSLDRSFVWGGAVWSPEAGPGPLRCLTAGNSFRLLGAEGGGAG